MKLAEALIERSDLQTRTEQLRQRLTANALVQEGERPAEDPAALLAELDSVSSRLEAIISRINLTNASTFVGDKTLTELLSRREVLARQVSILQSLLDAASKTVLRGSRMEVKIHSTVDVPALRKQADELSRQLRVLDTSIQSANWLEDLR